MKCHLQIFYLKVREKETQRKKGMERGRDKKRLRKKEEKEGRGESCSWFTTHLAAMSRPGQGVSQELHPELPCGGLGPRYLGHVHCSPGPLPKVEQSASLPAAVL